MSMNSNYKKKIVESTITTVLEKFFKPSYNDINYILKGNAIINILSRSQSKYLDLYKKPMTEEILWIITGDPYAPYYYVLYENLFNNLLIDKLNWIIDDYYNNFYTPNLKNNITIVNKNFQKLHRSGWQYVVDNITKLNIDTPLIIDTYIDKTFHWNKEFYKTKKVIPYKNIWVGFIHHTYSEYDNTFNCTELFNDKVFIESLKTCKCLIVMTEYLSLNIKESLTKLNITNVDVVTIIHPTENTDINFKWELFINNKNKSVVQIGNWLRDVFAIYKVTLPKSSIVTRKAILQNKNSENYLPPNNLLDTLNSSFESTTNSVDICRNSFSNMHIKGLLNHIAEMENSVEIIQYLDNEQYDKLLSNNIVFLNLIDASACNTLLECITRNTPIIINPIPNKNLFSLY